MLFLFWLVTLYARSHYTADPIAMPFLYFDLCVTDCRTGPDFNNVISISLSLHPKSSLPTLSVWPCSMQNLSVTLLRELRFPPSFHTIKWAFRFWLNLGFVNKVMKWSVETCVDYFICSFPCPSCGGGIAVFYSDTWSHASPGYSASILQVIFPSEMLAIFYNWVTWCGKAQKI